MWMVVLKKNKKYVIGTHGLHINSMAGMTVTEKCMHATCEMCCGN